MDLPDLGDAARSWFEDQFESPTPVQSQGWERIAAGENALLIAPTGSGKTLAAFFYFIDRLSRRSQDAEPGVRVLYLSPLKALVHDIERNLRGPLIGIQQEAERLGEVFHAPRVAIRTGDTSARDRRLQLRDPAEILVTTPESLYLLLTSKAKETLRTVEVVIVDEIHALAPTKRGAHLALSLERLAMLATRRDAQRIGLSATARPLDAIAGFLGGTRPVSIVDTSVRPNLGLTISVPVADMSRPEVPSSDETPPDTPPTMSLWPALYPKILEAIRSHQSSIVFVNSRGLCEKLAHELNELAEEPLVRAHHGSIAHDKRIEIEESLKSGELRAIVATSSLELGIDMGAVSLVLLVESPGAVARGLQRVGRAGHKVGETSIGLLFPKHRGDLLESVVVAEGMRRGEVEPISVPRNPLDVLAQQIVAMVSQEKLSAETVYESVRRAANFSELPKSVFEGVLEMLSGRYPSTDFSDLRPRLIWDRNANTLEARSGTGRIAILSGGTIPDRGLYAVHMGEGGPRIGELDEEMVHESRPGDAVTLGASTWRIAEITRDRVIVVPAPGEVGRLPFWRGEGPGRPAELGRRLGAFAREVGERLGLDVADAPRLGAAASPAPDAAPHVESEAETLRWLRETHGLDAFAAANLVRYLADQFDATRAIPTDRSITIERFRDELGDWRICILSPFGARLHTPWALAIEAQLSAEVGFEVETLASDDGIVLRFADADRVPGLASLLPDPDDVADQVVGRLAGSSLFAAQFRENAARALLLPRRRPGMRTPLWVQRLRSQNLLAVAQGFPDFPIMLETYRSCLQDVFDLDGLRSLLREIRQREIRVDEVETRTASPFARSLVFEYTATYLYQLDLPAAERRAQALTLDRQMLRELLGEENLRSLLDVQVLGEVEASLQGRTTSQRVRHADGVHDLLRRLGDLTGEEIALRCEDGRAEAWTTELEAAQRIVCMPIGGERRWVVVEDAALYRDALGARPPSGLPPALLSPVARPFEQLILRWARTRGPFAAEAFARRYGVAPGSLDPVLTQLEASGRLLAGEFHPDGTGPEWCEPEVLRRLRRATLARLRDEVAPVKAPVFTRFMMDWQGLLRPIAGETRLAEVLDQLEGVPLSFSELEQSILPARVADYDARMLDHFGALGDWVWLGHSPLGDRDGRVALYRRERLGELVVLSELSDDAGPLHQAVLDCLAERGASFFSEILAGCPSADQRDVFEALWDLVWWGQVTNDTFAPLRGRATPPAAAAMKRRRRPPAMGKRAPVSALAGRWSRVEDLLRAPAEPTVRAHERTLGLLQRYGVLSRDAMALEEAELNWSLIYPVLRAMEESGKVRRGYFVEGLRGAQFALESVVDRLRGARSPKEARSAILVGAADPANPYGALLPWPPCQSEAARPRRAAGVRLVLLAGEPILFTDPSAKKVWTFAGDPDAKGTAETVRDDAWLAAARALGRAGPRFPRGGLRIEQIDGQPARSEGVAAVASAFLRAGYRASYKGIELEKPFLDG